MNNMNNSFVSTDSENLGTKSNIKKKQYDYLFKIVLIGDSGVGKSSVLLRFADDQFSENFYSTIGVDFRFKCLDVQEKKIKLQIWDTAGQERFKTITSAYYRGADGIIFVYDVTDKSSFTHLKGWLDDVSKLTTDEPIKLIIGNKSDLTNKEVKEIDINNFKQQTGIDIVEVSAKSSYKINDIFETITQKLITRAEQKKIESLSQNNYKISSSSNLSKKAGECCKFH